jgi:hypothetical protein
LIIVPYLFDNQQYNTNREDNGWCKTVVVLAVSMPEGIHTDNEGYTYHPVFQGNILNDIDTKNREAGE